MSIAAVIPVKRLGEAKGRIAGRLGPSGRRELVLRMLESELAALGEVEEITAIFVVTPDERIAESARRSGAQIVDDPAAGLNAAIEAGRRIAQRRGFEYVLVLHGDLPFLSAGEIRDMLALAASDAAILAPDRWGQGTNALLLPAGAPFEVAFGPDSYRRHLERATAAGLEPRTFRSPGTSFDLDTADDFDEFQRSTGGMMGSS